MLTVYFFRVYITRLIVNFIIYFSMHNKRSSLGTYCLFSVVYGTLALFTVQENT